MGADHAPAVMQLRAFPLSATAESEAILLLSRSLLSALLGVKNSYSEIRLLIDGHTVRFVSKRL